MTLESLAQKPQGERGRQKTTIQQETRERQAHEGGETGVRHQTLTRREWLRAGAGNKTIKETEETQNRALHSWSPEEESSRLWWAPDFTSMKLNYVEFLWNIFELLSIRWREIWCKHSCPPHDELLKTLVIPSPFILCHCQINILICPTPNICKTNAVSCTLC